MSVKMADNSPTNPPSEAVQWNRDGDHPNVVAIPAHVYYEIEAHSVAIGLDSWRWIETPEGGHIVQPGDWIVTGANGEQYPCEMKP